jgi:hypothetical protein
MFLHTIRNRTAFANKYSYHPEAVIIACYFNPQNLHIELVHSTISTIVSSI